jgi:hypothetical protein
MPTPTARRVASPGWVALCAWVVPGGGYFLLRERSRAITICVTIVLLFLLGILVGGIRVMDPPGWGEHGYMAPIVKQNHGDNRYPMMRIEPSTEDQENHPDTPSQDGFFGSALAQQPLAELGNKPWFVGQILCGPITLMASAVSVHEAKPPALISGSHSRSWEIGALYTAVAGMLNLLEAHDAPEYSSVHSLEHSQRRCCLSTDARCPADLAEALELVAPALAAVRGSVDRLQIHPLPRDAAHVARVGGIVPDDRPGHDSRRRRAGGIGFADAVMARSFMSGSD